MRTLTLSLLVAGALHAQPTPRLSTADSALVAAVLLAEDRRDSTDAALVRAAEHADPRLRSLAWRATQRIRDPRFVARDSLAALPSAPGWPEPEWRLRYRALTARSTCSDLVTALTDATWIVRLRASELGAARCGARPEFVRRAQEWIAALPADLRSRPKGGVSWHAAARGLETLAQLQPESARAMLRRFTEHPHAALRRAAARTAVRVTDTAVLRALAADADPNVREAALQGLGSVAGHAGDAVYLAALDDSAAQVVRAAALALRGSALPDATARALRAWERWVARNDASAHDARVALLAVAGRPASDDRPPAPSTVAPPDLVALALGAEILLHVTMDAAEGGGRFTVRLRGDVAPMMAARILALVRAGYYDGLTWHRVEHDFVVQGGSPLANEYVGLSSFLRDELGTLPHPRGTIGMSTRGHDTGDAQWFINLRDNARLMRDYTVFAEIVDGIEVVDDIMEGDRIASIRVAPSRR
jgi:cyclophilin family peptidyl-prolyl cis-trans isomerase